MLIVAGIDDVNLRKAILSFRNNHVIFKQIKALYQDAIAVGNEFFPVTGIGFIFTACHDLKILSTVCIGTNVKAIIGMVYVIQNFLAPRLKYFEFSHWLRSCNVALLRRKGSLRHN